VTGDFSLPRLERVVSGPGTIDTLGDELDRRGATRVVVVTGRTLGASPLLDRVRRPIGERCVGVFATARQHVPASTVEDLARLIDRERADGVVSFGGGSPIDTAKVALHRLMTPAGHPPAPAEGPPHIAVPTTLSAGEFTSVAGVTDEQTRTKRAVHDARIAPRAVIADATLTLATPAWLWAATGIRSVDHAVESMYASRHHPFSDAVASRGLALLVRHLPSSIAGDVPAQLTHRSQCQIAAWMAVFGMTNAGFGLSHALGHQIGPRWNVAHGVTSCITLPHVMRFMAGLAPERFEPIAAGLGVAFEAGDAGRGARACADRVEALITALGLPRRLRDVDVPSDGLADVARVVHGLMDAGKAVGRPVTVEEIESLLAEAY
jgi:alcohol dehydrogenase